MYVIRMYVSIYMLFESKKPGALQAADAKLKLDPVRLHRDQMDKVCTCIFEVMASLVELGDACFDVAKRVVLCLAVIFELLKFLIRQSSYVKATSFK